MAQTLDKKVWSREFREYDLVLRKVLHFPYKDHRKWALNYKGPYMVKKKKTFSIGALILTSMNGEDVIRLVN
jgi:hypothetical protein